MIPVSLPFLGVAQSATGRVWRDRLDARGAARALAIAQRHGMAELLARILAGRGVEAEEAAAFLDPTVRDLMPDPTVLADMPAAAARIADAVIRGETVAVFGDYDVDGASSAAVLARFLRQAGIDPIIHIPDRLFEGYGPNVDAVRMLAAKGAKLLITVDCGTSSHEPLAEARRLGMETIVIDHHLADEALPGALAMVNPNRLDDLSRLGHLAAVGLVFMVVVAVNRELRARGFWNAPRSEPDLLALLDLVALGTVADVVPLTGLNRAFVAKGLLAMRRRENIGLTALMDAARLGGPPEPWHLGFLLGPRINAGGRIGRADLGVELLLAADPIEAAKLAAEHWHPGVVGLVAARLKERFGRPAFAIALEPGGIGTGSGRSIAGVDIGTLVRQAVREGLLLKGGGHAMAAGVTLKRDALAAFRAFLEEGLGEAVAAARRTDALLIDGALTAGAASLETIVSISRAGPFGAGNPEPVLAFPAHQVVYADEVGQSHVRLRLRAGDGAAVSGIAFRAAGQKLGMALLQNHGRAVHAAGCLAIDRWNGEERVQLRLIDIAPTEPVGSVA